MKNYFNFYVLLSVLLILNLNLVFCKENNDLQDKHDAFNQEEFGGFKAKTTPNYQPKENTEYPKLSCVLMKSLVYGLQKAVSEFSLTQNNSNLSRVVREIDFNHYLSDFCGEMIPEPVSGASGGKKVKRNSKSTNNATQPTGINGIPVNFGGNTTNNKEQPHDEIKFHDKHQKLNEFERLMRNFEDVTNALRLELQQVQQTPDNHKLSSVAVPTLPKHEHSHAPNPSITSNSDAMTKHVNLKNFNATQSKLNSSAVIETNSTNHDVNAKLTNVTAQEKSRHAHYHKKHHTKSKVNKTKPKTEFPIDDDNLSNADDRYVSERLKQDDQSAKDEKFNESAQKHHVKRSVRSNKDSKMQKNKNKSKTMSKQKMFGKSYDKKLKTKGKSHKTHKY